MRDPSPARRRSLRLSALLLLPIPAAAWSLRFSGCPGRVKGGGSLRFKVDRLDGRPIPVEDLEIHIEDLGGRRLGVVEGGRISLQGDGSLYFAAPRPAEACVVVIRAALPALELEGSFRVDVVLEEVQIPATVPVRA